jgi:hypothetical protein
MKTAIWGTTAHLFTSLTLLLTWTAGAEDSFPPCWRGNPAATYQNWTFAVSNNPAPPDDFTNVNGTPLATMTVGAFGTGWKQVSVGLRSNVWDLGQAGQATIALSNFTASAAAWKYVHLQVTYYDAPGFYLPPVISISNATMVSSQVTNNQSAPPGNWKTIQSVWLLQPSPSSENILLAGDTSRGLLIDQMLVDTLVLDFPCPTNITGNADPGQCSKSNVNLSLPVADGCIITNVSSTPATGSTFPVGTNQVTSTITDYAGKTKTCNFKVIIADNQPPSIITCPTNRTVLGCQATIPDVTGEVVATDNCGNSLTITQSPIAGSPIVTENTQVTITVQDPSQNITTCNLTVTLRPPALTISLVGQSVSLTWPGGGTLLQAFDVTGPWNPISGAASPYSIPQPLLARSFYRLQCN